MHRFRVLDDDPFHLAATEDVLDWLRCYFDDRGFFLLHKFMLDLLQSVNSLVCSIFDNQRNPPRLERVTTNEEFANRSQV